MPKLENGRYPEIDAEEAAEVAETLVNQYGGEVNSEEAFAQSIGHKSTNSGTYMSKMADCRQYGILPSRGLKATELANVVANPKDQEEWNDAIFKMYRNIPILEDLYENLNGEMPPEELWRVVSEITGANPKESRDAADTLRDLYSNMLRHTPQEGGSGSRRESEDSREIPDEGSSDVPSKGVFVKVGEDQLKLQEKTDANIDLAKRFLDSKMSEPQDE